jgi:hypothetical protein
VLKDILDRKIKDTKTISLLEEVIESYSMSGTLREKERERERVKRCRFLQSTIKECRSAT